VHISSTNQGHNSALQVNQDEDSDSEDGDALIEKKMLSNRRDSDSD